MGLDNGSKVQPEVDSSWDHLTQHVFAGPRSFAYFLPIAILPFALLIPPSVLPTNQLRIFILPLSLASFLYYHVSDGGFDVMTVGVLLWTFTLIGYYDPRKDFRNIHRLSFHDENAQQMLSKKRKGNHVIANGTELKAHTMAEGQEDTFWEESYPTNFTDRIKWIMSLIVSLRFHNWKIGDPSHDRHQPTQSQPRNAFLRTLVIGLLRTYLILDTGAYFSRLDPYFHSTKLSIIDLPSHPFYTRLSHYRLGFLIVLLREAVIQAIVYGSISFYTFYGDTFLITVLALIFPFSHDWQPWNWPIYFGPFSSIPESGLRGLWGRWWHQYMRNLCTPPGRVIADWLALPARSQSRYLVLSASAFFFSGIIHTGLVPPRPIYADISAFSIRLLWASFFWIQFPGVVIEVLVSKAANNYFSPSFMKSPTRKTITFLWTATWLCLSFPFIAAATRQLNLWNSSPVPISLWSGILEGNWVMWG